MISRIPFFAIVACSLVACSGTSKTREVSQAAVTSAVKKPSENRPQIPGSYKDIIYPELNYTAPFPADFRVRISDSVTGYIQEDRTLPLIHFNVFFKDNLVADSVSNEAAYELLSPMFRRGGSVKISPQVLDDSLEFVAASLAGAVGTFQSVISVECMAKDFPELLALAKDVFLSPAFDDKALEIQKANAAKAYEHRFDNPTGILAALEKFANYEPNPRLWNATAEEFRKVSRNDLLKIAKERFHAGRIVFAIAGDFDRDSMETALREYFKEWPAKAQDKTEIPPLRLRNKPGIYLVNKEISQANISMSAPFVKRPHPDYYPTAVSSFILGGGSFSSRLMSRVRSDNGLAYSIYSTVDNDYRDTGLVTIALQTKVESASEALRLVKEEVLRLAKDGPTEAELEQAKKTLIESLPSLFDSPASTTILFAKGELLGKKDSHYVDYVNEIGKVTAEQVRQMIAKYFAPEKMTVSIVGPAEKLKDLGSVTIVPLDSLDFRK